MSNTRSFVGIPFWNGGIYELIQAADREGGLFTVPSAPSMAMMRTDPLLATAYQSSDWAVVDGGYVALVLRLVFRRNLPRISGLQILQRLVGEKDRRAIPFQERKVLWVVPNLAEKARIEALLKESGFDETRQSWYQAGFYRKDEDFNDSELNQQVRETEPDWVVLCIGGGKQEKLGYFLRTSNVEHRTSNVEKVGFEHRTLNVEHPTSNVEEIGKMEAPATHLLNSQPTINHQPVASGRKNGPVILCTGGAISFLSGGQANIPTWADRLYLGWLFRVLQSPKTFLPRYWNAGYEFPLLLWQWRNRLFQ